MVFLLTPLDLFNYSSILIAASPFIELKLAIFNSLEASNSYILRLNIILTVLRTLSGNNDRDHDVSKATWLSEYSVEAL
jgi:hypothetical protein